MIQNLIVGNSYSLSDLNQELDQALAVGFNVRVAYLNHIFGSKNIEPWKSGKELKPLRTDSPDQSALEIELLNDEGSSIDHFKYFWLKFVFNQGLYYHTCAIKSVRNRNYLDRSINLD